MHGTFEELEGSTAKQKLHDFSEGIKHIINRKEHRKVDLISEFSGKSYAKGIPVVFKINIKRITGKRDET